MRDDDARVAGGLGNLTAVANLHLNGAACGTFGHLADGEHVANVKGSLGSAVDGLAGGGALGGDEGLSVLAEIKHFYRVSNPVLTGRLLPVTLPRFKLYCAHTRCHYVMTYRYL